MTTSTTGRKRTGRTTRTTTPTTVRALGYLRVSTDGQVESGAGLDAQRAALLAEGERRGWDVEIVTDAGLSGKNMRRPGLLAALDRLDRGEADVLVATKLDRVSRSVRDFAGLLDRAQHNGWTIVLLDLGDTSTAAGEMTANVIASAAQYERRLIGQRTREGLAAKRAAGVRLGRPSALPLSVVVRIVDEHLTGRSLRAIAEGLTADGVPTARGGEWRASTVQAVIHGQDAETIRAAHQETDTDQRTDDVVHVKRTDGVHLGRPATLPREVVERIVRARDGGTGWSEIARQLEADGVPTAQGGARWYPATVRKVYAGQDAAAARAR